MTDALRLAVGTLTRWPVPAPRVVDRTAARGAMMLAPWIGLALGTLAGAIAWLGGYRHLSSLVVATVAIAFLAHASRGLHLDGLADTADGLGSGRDAATALDIMRRGDVGPMGAATLSLTLLLQVVALDQVLSTRGPVALGVVVATSRLALTVACTPALTAARPEGLGATVAGSVPISAAIVNTALVALVGFGLFQATGTPPGDAVIASAATVAGGLLAAAVVLRAARRRLGGVTGDVLGAAVELALAGGLLGLCLVG
ncbi:MAG: adenosylcobinamide-GDP ribazoletransferase [Kineosporiaceae bacterium]|nr:adenosylcobinamide-GDP ribazoletransferase [Kineosporiaceae bacterium]MBK8077130.1 adenosylcobinamide-GDP ribazoletransferase [Kineosporiaceae bacterium]